MVVANKFGIVFALVVAGLAVPSARAQQAAGVGSPFELAYWQSIANSRDPVFYQAYLRQYPDGTFAAIARVRSGTAALATASVPNDDGASQRIADAPGVEFGPPPRPRFMPVPAVNLPPTFCSTGQRNQFHTNVYAPAMAAAAHNNDAAVAYVRQLQSLYDSHQLDRARVREAIAAAARAFQPEAAAAYTVQNRLVHVFDALMAVPIIACAALQ